MTAMIRAFARDHGVRVDVGDRSYGRLAPAPRVSGSANITAGGHVVARVTGAVAIDKGLVTTIESATPMPAHAALLFVRNGQVLAGGPRGATAHPRGGRLELASVPFESGGARVGRRLNSRASPTAARSTSASTTKSRTLGASAGACRS